MAVVPVSFEETIPKGRARSRAQDIVNNARDEAMVLARRDRKAFLRLLKITQAELAQRMAGNPLSQFTAVQADATMVLVRVSLAAVEKKLGVLLVQNALTAHRIGAKSTAKMLSLFESDGKLSLTPLALRPALALSNDVLSRHGTSVDRYGKHMIGRIREELQKGMILGESFTKMRERLTGIKGPNGIVSMAATTVNGEVFRLREESIKEGLFVRHASWADRIIRTESMAALNQGALDECHEELVRFPDMQKKLIETFDRRTAPDSYVAHGQVRDLGGLFTDGKREYPRPPGRPNDRAVLIPWRAEWGG